MFVQIISKRQINPWLPSSFNKWTRQTPMNLKNKQNAHWSKAYLILKGKAIIMKWESHLPQNMPMENPIGTYNNKYDNNFPNRTRFEQINQTLYTFHDGTKYQDEKVYLPRLLKIRIRYQVKMIKIIVFKGI